MVAAAAWDPVAAAQVPVVAAWGFAQGLVAGFRVLRKQATWRMRAAACVAQPLLSFVSLVWLLERADTLLALLAVSDPGQVQEMR